MRRSWQVLVVLLFFGSTALGTIVGTVRGIVHDPQHRPVSDAQVVLKAKMSDYSQKVQTDAEGQFHFDSVPVGEYDVEVSQSAFTTGLQSVTVLSGTAPILHFELALATQSQSISVSATDSGPAQSESVTPTTLVDRQGNQQIDYYSDKWHDKEVLKDIQLLASIKK
jgi:hypothetical protein